MNSLLKHQYGAIWYELSKSLMDFRGALKTTTLPDEEYPYHKLLQEIYFLPKIILSDYLRESLCKQNAPNVGSVTGIFFEELIACLVSSKISSDIIVYRNYSDSDVLKKSPLQISNPDIYIRKGNKHFIIETKFVAHTSTIVAVESQLESMPVNENDRSTRVFSNQLIQYYLIGGWSSIDFAKLSDSYPYDWLCLLDGSETNIETINSLRFTKFDSILKELSRFLS